MHQYRTRLSSGFVLLTYGKDFQKTTLLNFKLRLTKLVRLMMRREMRNRILPHLLLFMLTILWLLTQPVPINIHLLTSRNA